MFDFEIQTEDYFTLGQFYHLSKITQFDNSSLLILELNRKRTLVWFIVGLATCWVNRVSHAFSPLSQRVSNTVCGWQFVCVYISDQIASVYIVSGLQPNGQCEFRLQGQCGFRLQCLVLPANWAVWIRTAGAVWIQTAVFSPASQLGSVDSDRSVCLSAKWCGVDSHWLVIT